MYKEVRIMSTFSKVESRLNHLQRGKPFSIERFYTLGTVSAVQKAMSRMAQGGVIERVSKGYYVRPKPLKAMPSIKMTTSAKELAAVWAKDHGYTLVPQGLEAAHRLGLQQQAPMKVVYWSSGPSREFRIGNEVVEVKHRADRALLWPNKPEGSLLRGLLVLSPNEVADSEVMLAFKRLSLAKPEALQAIKKLRDQVLPQDWQKKLAHCEEMLMQ
jgi:hypothetical protein